MSEIRKYDDSVNAIKNAILQSQYDAARTVNEKQLILYYGIGRYLSANTRSGKWGSGAIDTISERLQKELPGLKGFSARNLRYMRTFYEEWSVLDDNADDQLQLEDSNLAHACAELTGQTDLEFWHMHVPKLDGFPVNAFLSIGFSHHRLILTKVKDISERLYYIERCASERFSYEYLGRIIDADEYHHQGALPNNFKNTMTALTQAFRAINTFKDEYLLDFINVEELNIRDVQDIDEKVVEELVRIKKETSELGTGDKIPELDRYLREQIEALQVEADKAENRKNDWNRLEEFFRGAVI